MDSQYSSFKANEQLVTRLWTHFGYTIQYLGQQGRVINEWTHSLMNVTPENYRDHEYGDHWLAGITDTHERKEKLYFYGWLLRYHFEDMIRPLTNIQAAGLFKMLRFRNDIAEGILKTKDAKTIEKIVQAIVEVVYTDDRFSTTSFILVQKMKALGHQDMVTRINSALCARMETLSPTERDTWLRTHQYTLHVIQHMEKHVFSGYDNLRSSIQQLNKPWTQELIYDYQVQALPPIRIAVQPQFERSSFPWIVLSAITTSKEEQYTQWLNAFIEESSGMGSTIVHILDNMHQAYGDLDENVQTNIQELYYTVLAFFGLHDKTNDPVHPLDIIDGENVQKMSDAQQMAWLIGRHMKNQHIPIANVSANVQHVWNMRIDLGIPLAIKSIMDVQDLKAIFNKSNDALELNYDA